MGTFKLRYVWMRGAYIVLGVGGFYGKYDTLN